MKFMGLYIEMWYVWKFLMENKNHGGNFDVTGCQVFVSMTISESSVNDKNCYHKYHGLNDPVL